MAILLVRPESEGDWRRARLLVEEYAASLGVDLSFQDSRPAGLADAVMDRPGAHLANRPAAV